MTTQEEARAINSAGTRYLLQRAFKEQYKLLKRYCKNSCSGPSVEWLKQGYGSSAAIQDAVIDFVEKIMFGSQYESLISGDQFQAIVHATREAGYYKRGQELVDHLLLVLRQRKDVFEMIKRFGKLTEKSGSGKTDVFTDIHEQLDTILPHDFLQTFTEKQLLGAMRYLKSLGIRTQRAYANPAKDAEKRKKILPHREKSKRISE